MTRNGYHWLMVTPGKQGVFLLVTCVLLLGAWEIWVATKATLCYCIFSPIPTPTPAWLCSQLACVTPTLLTAACGVGLILNILVLKTKKKKKNLRLMSK